MADLSLVMVLMRLVMVLNSNAVLLVCTCFIMEPNQFIVSIFLFFRLQAFISEVSAFGKLLWMTWWPKECVMLIRYLSLIPSSFTHCYLPLCIHLHLLTKFIVPGPSFWMFCWWCFYHTSLWWIPWIVSIKYQSQMPGWCWNVSWHVCSANRLNLLSYNHCYSIKKFISY